MKHRSALLGGLLALLVSIGSIVYAVMPAQAAAGFTISNGRLLDANGNAFVMRGVNHAHTWYPTQTTKALADIKATGANTVRVVLAGGVRWGPNTATEVSGIVAQCKANRLICVLEDHDTTGYGEDGAAGTLAQAVDYWISIKSALAGQERYVILNIGNEPWGNTNYTQWTAATTSAITRLRAAGFEHTIMVDAPNWGQDWAFTMRDNAASVFAADPARNTIFSIHMYGVFDTAAEINDYLGRFITAKLPIVVGEFGFNHSDGNPDEDTILATTQAQGIGWLGWSWSGNGAGVEYLDLTTGFNPAALTTWGQRLINGANGIKATAREASVFGGSTPPSTPTSSRPVSPSPSASRSSSPSPSVPSSPPPASSPAPGTRGCTAVYSVSNQWGDGFQGNVTVTAGSAAVTGWTVTWTWANGQRMTNSWNAATSTSGSTVTARNMPYNGSLGAGASTSFGFTASRTATNTAPTATCVAS
jgi:mannan endo-1,4-beta-mannosidase